MLFCLQFFEKVEDESAEAAADAASSNTESASEDVSAAPVSSAQPDRTITITDPQTNAPIKLNLKAHDDSSSSKRRGEYTPRALEEIIGVDTGGPHGRRKDDPGHTKEMYTLFADFIRTMLVFDPAKRVSPTEALQHPYLHVNLDATSTAEGAKADAPSSGQEAASEAAQKNEDQSNSSSVAAAAEESKAGLTASLPPPPLTKRRSSSAPRLSSYSSPATSQSSKKSLPTPPDSEVADSSSSIDDGPAATSAPAGEDDGKWTSGTKGSSASYVMELNAETSNRLPK